MDIADLIRSLLQVAPAELADDASATGAVLAVRWPNGARCIACDAPASPKEFELQCAASSCGQRFSIFVGTPLESLRRPRPRVLLIALRAMATDERGISARALSRCLGVPHVTVWRHLHRLRVLLPGRVPRRDDLAHVQVCGRRSGAPPADVRTGARIVGESIRTWLNGTFHGVTARWLANYQWEASARAVHGAAHCLTCPLAALLVPAARGA